MGRFSEGVRKEGFNKLSIFLGKASIKLHLQKTIRVFPDCTNTSPDCVCQPPGLKVIMAIRSTRSQVGGLMASHHQEEGQGGLLLDPFLKETS